MADLHVIAHCRAGFEPEAAADLARIAARARVGLAPEIDRGRAFVVAAVEGWSRGRWTRACHELPPVFCRSLVVEARHVELGERDRIAPLLAAAQAMERAFGAVWLETGDSNEGRSLSGFCRRFAPLLERALTDAGVVVQEGATDRLRVLFTSREAAWVGVADERIAGPWPMGIPRLRMPAKAPSRSVAKLAEALIVFLGEHEHEWLHAGMRAVDLGAAPGGWSWLLAHRGVRVTAVDNGPLKGEVADDPLVKHLRVDGLTFRPPRPVDWMVCDIALQPSRIATVVGEWIAGGHARRCIFNLKLPMKRRYDEVARCRQQIVEAVMHAGVRASLGIRQLYHDREEVTGYIARE